MVQEKNWDPKRNFSSIRAGCPATWKTWKTWNTQGILFALGKTWKTQGIFLPVYENFLNGLLFKLLPDNDRKIICKNNDCI